MNLKTNVRKLIEDTIRMCANCEGAEKLRYELEKMAQRLNEPLRVAVFGLMKAGKSTLLNAIMKEKILFTGNLETTYRTNWFKYADTPSITVVFKDGSKENHPLEDLEKWTVRLKKKENPRIEDAKHVEINYPNNVLKSLEIIDTPGLGSSHKSDSQNTLDLMGVKEEDRDEEIAATRVTMVDASAADALIYAFSHAPQASDREILDAFYGGESTAPNSSPVNAIGVFTKADIFWDVARENDPMLDTKQVSENLMKDNTLKQLLYTIKPVCAKVVESFSELKEEDWDILRRLASLDEKIFREVIFDASEFKNCSAEEFAGMFESAMDTTFTDEQRRNVCSAAERGKILDLLGQYGIRLGINALKAGIPTEDMVEYFYEKSGIGDVCKLVFDHFGNRSYLLKLNYIFTHLKATASQIMIANSTDKELKSICENLSEEIINIMDTDQSFKELRVLQNFYNGYLKLGSEKEKEWMMQITGEYGKDCEAKLGADAGTNIRTMKQIAADRVKYWNERENDIPYNRYYREAAQILSRSYNILYYHLDALVGD